MLAVKSSKPGRVIESTDATVGARKDDEVGKSRPCRHFACEPATPDNVDFVPRNYPMGNYGVMSVMLLVCRRLFVVVVWIETVVVRLVQ